jgi:PHD/YefM family antitoxin component YafN of YafNO toxin-antitoxin module
MERILSATEVRARFIELMQWVIDGDETVIVKRYGVPRIAILSIDRYKYLKGKESSWDSWEADLYRLHEHLQAELGEREILSSVEIIRQMREERDEQLAGLR